jgi:hypothetical protein
MTDEKTSASITARNVYQRKRAVMERCGAIKLDKKHPHHKFEYVSIQNLSNSLRAFMVEAGLECVPSVQDGYLTIELVNVDKPEERIISSWPLAPDDKGFAYSIKYPLMRLFLVGDGEEGGIDGVQQAPASQRAQPPTPPPANGQSDKPKVACPKCGSIGTVFGKRNSEEGQAPFFCSSSKGGCGKGISQEEFERAKAVAEGRDIDPVVPDGGLPL